MQETKQRYLYEYGILEDEHCSIHIMPIVKELEDAYLVINSNGILIKTSKPYMKRANEICSCKYYVVDERNDEVAIAKIYKDIQDCRIKSIKEKMEEINYINATYDEHIKILKELNELKAPLEFKKNSTEWEL